MLTVTLKLGTICVRPGLGIIANRAAAVAGHDVCRVYAVGCGIDSSSTNNTDLQQRYILC